MKQRTCVLCEHRGYEVRPDPKMGLTVCTPTAPCNRRQQTKREVGAGGVRGR